MVQLQALNGKLAGKQWFVRHFPVQLGRSQACDVPLDEAGVWDKHAQIARLDNVFSFRVHPPALATVNREPATEHSLRNGDTIELGGAQLRFSLSPTRPRSVWFRETMTWLGLAVLCLLQVWMIYLLT